MSANAQVVGGGPVIGGGGGSGGGVTGLTSCADGTALADNALMRADGTTKCQGSTVTVDDSTGNLQWEGTTADGFEGNFTFADPTADWTWAWGAAGDLVGAGSLSIDNLRLDGNTISSTDTNGNIVFDTNGTGQLLLPIGSEALPGLSVTGDTNTGIHFPGDGSWFIRADGFRSLSGNYNTMQYHGELFHAQTSAFTGFLNTVLAISNGVGSPLSLSAGYGRYLFTNEGVTAMSYATLHEAVTGFEFKACVQDSDGMRFTAASGDTIRSGASVTTAGGYVESTTIGSCLEAVRLNSTEWMLLSVTGTWSFN